MYTELKMGDRVVSIRLGSDTVIPIEPKNSDYQVYLKWLEAGNIPEAEVIG